MEVILYNFINITNIINTTKEDYEFKLVLPYMNLSIFRLYHCNIYKSLSGNLYPIPCVTLFYLSIFF
jgi:hypothetical protein